MSLRPPGPAPFLEVLWAVVLQNTHEFCSLKAPEAQSRAAGNSTAVQTAPLALILGVFALLQLSYASHLPSGMLFYHEKLAAGFWQQIPEDQTSFFQFSVNLEVVLRDRPARRAPTDLKDRLLSLRSHSSTATAGRCAAPSRRLLITWLQPLPACTTRSLLPVAAHLSGTRQEQGWSRRAAAAPESKRLWKEQTGPGYACGGGLLHNAAMAALGGAAARPSTLPFSSPAAMGSWAPCAVSPSAWPTHPALPSAHCWESPACIARVGEHCTAGCLNGCLCKHKPLVKSRWLWPQLNCYILIPNRCLHVRITHCIQKLTF